MVSIKNRQLLALMGSRKRRQTGIDVAAHPPGREAPRSSSSADDTGSLTVLPLAETLDHAVHESAECFRAVLSVLGELLRALLRGRRFRSDNRDLGRIEL